MVNAILSLFVASALTACAKHPESEQAENAGGQGNGGRGGGGTSGDVAGGKAAGGSSGAGGGGSSGAARGGSGDTGGTSGEGGSDCSGDADAFEELTRGPIACSKNSDCCVVIDTCMSEGKVVAAGNEAAAHTAWPRCDDDCTDCIPPAVVVGCDDGTCVGTQLDEEDFDSPLRETHCGVDDEEMTPSAETSFECG